MLKVAITLMILAVGTIGALSIKDVNLLITFVALVIHRFFNSGEKTNIKNYSLVFKHIRCNTISYICNRQ